MAKLSFDALGFPKDIATAELRRRFRAAQENRIQLERWMDTVLEELMRRGG